VLRRSPHHLQGGENPSRTRDHLVPLHLARGGERGHVNEVIDGGVDSVAAVEEEADRP